MDRRTLVCGLAAVVTWGGMAVPSVAQQPYWQRDPVALNAPRTSTDSAHLLIDSALTPRRSRTGMGKRRELSERTPRPVPRPVTRTNAYSPLAGITSQDSARSQGPNRNMAQHSHCVPSRSAFAPHTVIDLGFEVGGVRNPRRS